MIKFTFIPMFLKTIKKILKKLLWKVFKYDTWSSVLHTSFGSELQGKRILLIQRNDSRAGLFSFFITNLGWIAYAYEKGFIPVIDMATFKNIYQTGNGCNSWELFFNQPDLYCLKDIKKAHDITIVRGTPEIFPNITMAFFRNKNGLLDYWRDIYRKHIHIHENILKKYVNVFFEAALSKHKVLGVMMRGTDYTALHPKEHPIQPSIEEMFARITNIYENEYQFSKIFLVTEDEDIQRRFSEKYPPNMLIYSGQSMIKYKGNGYLSEAGEVANDKERGGKYLRAIYDLSRCHYVIVGRMSGSVAMALMMKNDSVIQTFDLGVY